MLKNVSEALSELLRVRHDLTVTWVASLINIAHRPGATAEWLSSLNGQSVSIMNRSLHEMRSSTTGPATGWMDFIADPVNEKRHLWMLTNRGREVVETFLRTVYREPVVDMLTIEQYRDAEASSVSKENSVTEWKFACPFSQRQITSLKAAARKKHPDFVGDSALFFPIIPRSLEGPREWVKEQSARWYEMPTIYPDMGGSTAVDFDDEYTAFLFHLKWKLGIVI